MLGEWNLLLVVVCSRRTGGSSDGGKGARGKRQKVRILARSTPGGRLIVGGELPGQRAQILALRGKIRGLWSSYRCYCHGEEEDGRRREMIDEMALDTR